MNCSADFIEISTNDSANFRIQQDSLRTFDFSSGFCKNIGRMMVPFQDRLYAEVLSMTDAVNAPGITTMILNHLSGGDPSSPMICKNLLPYFSDYATLKSLVEEATDAFEGKLVDDEIIVQQSGGVAPMTVDEEPSTDSVGQPSSSSDPLVLGSEPKSPLTQTNSDSAHTSPAIDSLPNRAPALFEAVTTAVAASLRQTFREESTAMLDRLLAIQREQSADGRAHDTVPTRRTRKPRKQTVTKPKERSKPAKEELLVIHPKFRRYLREKGVLPKYGEYLPRSVPAHIVASYEKDGCPRPDIDNVVLDWRVTGCRANSQWNKEALGLLTIDFINRLKADKEIEYDKDVMSYENIYEVCQDKLKRVFEVMKTISIDSMGNGAEKITRPAQTSAEKAHTRRNARRIGTFDRREKIIAQNAPNDTQMWDGIGNVLEELTADGMSGDETEDEVRPSSDTRKVKEVRRLRMPWINPSISELLHIVETYYPACTDATGAVHRGAPPFTRHSQAVKEDNRKAVKGLPRNWYRDDWFRSLSPVMKEWLAAGEDKPIPTLPEYVRGFASKR
ncbi:hypothetical protein BD410DRAFT_810137 [Rickenella mellea]|uniref:Uncharacterized protein n=1 Tax=Rickenella mellea TaxID=50990 RepID=A0A4Y7PF31_9AGAM|nr:hypothetical protein BD410DRAFT_810137 [Rickenella mellea]